MEQNEFDYQISRDELPTKDEVEAVIFDMIAAEKRGVPDNSNLDELWASEAFDPQGEAQGYGFGHTPTEAKAGAWITTWWPECELSEVPRDVPEGWTFALYAPGNGPVFMKV
jgi:hypothetical protein